MKGAGKDVVPAIVDQNPDGGAPTVTPLSTGAVDYPPTTATAKKEVQGLTIGATNPLFTANFNAGDPIAALPLGLGLEFTRDENGKKYTLANGNTYTIVSIGDQTPPFPGAGGLAAPNTRLLHHVIVKNNP